MAKIILCANSKQATVGLWRMGRLISCTVFANDESGHDAFRKWLGQHRRIAIQIVANTGEEDFRLETLPHVSGHARKEMLERKLNQRYRNIDLRTAQFVSRESADRRDDSFLLMALTRPDAISPWMRIMEQLRAPLAGIYLMPVVSRLLVKALQIDPANLLLTTRHGAGLRQSHFVGSALRLSRLISDAGAQSPDLYVSEMEKTLLYLLNAQTSASKPAQLQLVFAGMDETDAALAQQIDHPQEASSMIIGTSDLAHRLGLDAERLRCHPDLAHMHLLARHGSPGNLAPAELLKPLRLRRLGTGLNVASAACLTGAAIAAAINVAATLKLEHQTRQLSVQTHQQEKLYAEVARNFPGPLLPGNDLKVAVELASKIDSLNRTPKRMMQAIGEAFDRQPEIRLDRLHWRVTDNLDRHDEEGQGNATAPPSSTTFHEIVFIEGEIANFAGDYRTALESVNELADQLRSNPQVQQAVILQQPINTSSLANLQGSTLDLQAQNISAAQFKLKIVLREPRP